MRRNTEAIVATTPNGNPSAVERIRETFHVHLVVDTSNPDRLTQAKVATNLLIRLFNHISVEGVNPAEELELPPSLSSRIAVGAEHRTNASAIIIARDNVRLHNEKALFVDNRGWTTYLSPQEPWKEERKESNSLGAMYAATLAVTECFNRAFSSLIEGMSLIHP